MTFTRAACAAALLLCSSACSFAPTDRDDASAGQRPVSADASLYERLGGRRALEVVVDDFVATLAGDPRVSRRFANADIPRLRRMLVEQICAASGGPCRYTGQDMRSAHEGMRITDSEFDALVDDLGKTLHKFRVPVREQRELIGALVPMKKDIVGL